jgi:hypothetical protein
MLGFAWTHGYGLLLAISGGIITIGGAVAVASGGAKWLLQQIRPSKPLVSFGHPSEQVIPLFSWGDDPGFDQRYEHMRLSSLEVSYLVENKDDVALRELTTGIRTRDGAHEITFDEHYVQILPAGETTEVTNVTVTAELHEGMTEENRAENFIYWAGFERAGKRWEASYDPRTRALSYRRLRR